MTYEASVAYMSGLLQFGIRLGRDRLRALLARLGNPHETLRCIHVAGTNGKGSTTTFLASVLKAQGYKTGAYLSPYVFDLRERIQIDGQMIPKEDFARWVTTIRPHIEAVARDPMFGQTTEFELKTTVAFCYFAEQRVDFAVLEVGIGGRLDSTNVIPPPLAAVITHIGLDHVNLLGDTLGKIAGEKAGIIKRGTPVCVTAVPPGEALDVIAAKAAAEECPLLRVDPAKAAGADDPDVFATYVQDPESGLVHIRARDGSLPLANLRLGLRGPFQAANAAVAATAIRALQERELVTIASGNFREGLMVARLPGRFQVVRDGSDGGPALVFDGAHNPDGARVLAEALTATFPARRGVLVVGTRHNHDAAPFLRILAPVTSRVVATAPPFKPQPASEVARAAARFGLPVQVIEPAAHAIEATLASASGDEVVVVTGSQYTVGETPPHLRGEWAPKEKEKAARL